MYNYKGLTHLYKCLKFGRMIIYLRQVIIHLYMYPGSLHLSTNSILIVTSDKTSKFLKSDKLHEVQM